MTMNSTEAAAGASTTPCGAPSAAVALFRSLGDPARLAILLRLAEGEARVVDLVACVGLAQSTVSAHLSCLRECGLVDYRPVGRASLYFLSRPELLDLLASAEQLLAATGEAVDLCPNYGTSAAEPGLKSEESTR
ncbi:metalloregulator ArsR/SmtB family transcription factor [Streptomyces sp. CdTB01]|uniref:ArsR/SmtB family transcription factor n=1 Tax=Streptomyces sp. CdTB01 TaxID=1725411 RepID=UPI00073A906F|nr:metalloregulator ArsR/SmtB family transcription factor [Streptomyces sp. CdTB01]ALV33188.1 ArsR family transcriptional regulator [Streptomyces sp. CdTB01]